MWSSTLVLLSLFLAADGGSGAPSNINVLLSTYLADGNTNGIDTATGTAVDSKGNIYVSGNGTYNFGLIPLGNTSKAGFILQLSASSLKPNRIFRFGSRITSIRVREGSNGLRIMVMTDLGAVVCDENFQQQYIVAASCGQSICVADLGRDGTLVVMDYVTPHLEVFINGQQTASKDLPQSNPVREVAVDPVNKRVIYSYYFNSRPHNIPVKVPCIIATDYSLNTQEWKDYCVSGDEDYSTQNMADSTPNHLYYSDIDDKLYMAGYTDGGNSIFRYDPAAIAAHKYSLHGLKMMDSDQMPAYDVYTQTYNFHGAHSITFMARMDPKNGAVEKGQFLVTRLSDGKGNSESTQAVAGGRGGLLVAAGGAASNLDNRDNQTINGQKTAAYGGSDGVLFVPATDFKSRLIWHQFQKTTGHSGGVAVAANDFNGKTRIAFLVKSQDSEFVTVHPWEGTGHASKAAIDQFALIITDV